MRWAPLLLVLTACWGEGLPEAKPADCMEAMAAYEFALTVWLNDGREPPRTIEPLRTLDIAYFNEALADDGLAELVEMRDGEVVPILICG